MSIPIEQRITAITLSLILFGVTVQLIRKHKLREEYALVWLAASSTIVILSIFGDLVNLLAASFAVSYAPTLILVGGLFFALVVLLSQSVVLSGQAKCIRDLAQTVSLLEWRLRQMEGAPPATAPPDPLRSNEAPPSPQRGERGRAKQATPPTATLPPPNLPPSTGSGHSLQGEGAKTSPPAGGTEGGRDHRPSLNTGGLGGLRPGKEYL